MKYVKWIFIICFLFQSFVFGSLWVNHTPGAYSQNNSTLESLTVQGAGCFIKANSEFLSFLQKYEINSADVSGMNEPLNNTIENLTGLVQMLSEIKSVSDQSSYNTAVLQKLAKYDYASVQNVKPFLAAGNIRGAFNDLLIRANDLLSRVTAIKQTVEKGMSPNVTDLFLINNKFIESMALGQNIAMVFKSIEGK